MIMPPDDKPPMPPQPPTIQMPKVMVPQTTLDAVLAEVRASRVENADKFGEIATRFSQIDEWRNEVDGWRKTNSLNAKAPSQHDLETARQLAEEIAARKALSTDLGNARLELAQVKAETKTQTDLLRTADATNARIEAALTGFFKNPKVRAVGQIIFTLATGYAAAKGLHVLP